MNERLLQYIWQFRLFDNRSLFTTTGEPVEIIYQGQYNTNQGPDFSNARIRIAGTTWAGHVELHVRLSDWEKHHHQADRNYDNVILHVVWEADETGPDIPAVELKGRVPGLFLERYEQLMKSGPSIPCGSQLHLVDALTWKSWLDRLLAERMERKAGLVLHFNTESRNHWEETAWWLLARNFGSKVNADAFEAIARSLPLSLLGRQAQLTALEALLMGQAGLLETEKKEDPYYTLLQKEYRFLQKKHSLVPVDIPVHFLRMRPGNFPTIRLAQLAVFLYQTGASGRFFSALLAAQQPDEIRRMFDLTANDYWHYHYSFDKTSAFKPKKSGDSLASLILINTVCPLLYAWGQLNRENRVKEKALDWLEKTPPEANHILSNFQDLGLPVKNAAESQAILELKNAYCTQKRCLDCMAGNRLLSKSATGR
ncbi:MAG: DUF2851 family protein [Chitinophagaceae bacterium]|nr:DUF2851 family protein [Chitinophagaceae bacterium]